MKRTLALVLAVMLVLAGVVWATGQAGSTSDPVISLSYIQQKFYPMLGEKVGERAKLVWDAPYGDKLNLLTKEGEDSLGRMSRAELIQIMADAYIAKTSGVKSGRTTQFTTIACTKGDVLTAGGIGTCFLLRSGGAQISGPTGRSVVNVSKGKDINVGAAAPVGDKLLVLDARNLGLTVTSNAAQVEVLGSYRVVPGYRVEYMDLADALKSMGLFLGTPSGYELDRQATRLEALVMLIRLLGEEKEAMEAAPSESPFQDVPEWGRPYVNYAYERGYTKGTSVEKKTFSPMDSVTAPQYVTFLLRALDYRDSAGGDFAWDKALSFAVSKDIFSAREADAVTNPFYRDQVVYLSYYALSAPLKGGEETLLDRLVTRSALSRTVADAAMAVVSRERLR